MTDTSASSEGPGIVDPKSDPQYIQFRCLPAPEPGAGGASGPVRLNRWSHMITRGHDFPGAQAMLYGAGVPDEETMKNAPHVGISTVWWEGNPCK